MNGPVLRGRPFSFESQVGEEDEENMQKFQKHYRAGRGLLALMFCVGLGVGLVGLTVLGFALISLTRSASGPSGSEWAMIAAGVIMVLAGLCTMGFSQGVRATFDTADMTGELLRLARNRAETPHFRRVDPSPVLGAAPDLRRTEPNLRSTPGVEKALPARRNPIFKARPPV